MKGLLNKYLLFVMGLVLSYMNVNAEEIPRGSIKGTVVTSDGNAAPSVTVLLKGTKKYAVTNEKGEFILRDVQPGTYELVVSLIGFNTIQQSVTVEADKQASTTF
ncbi:MAG TPA: carboxypeptidase-like regulatory domain-containing protein, partial [Chitinophaga sp.]|uniref:carboxypeptidase-like regulatory domain-containing protein n=1 Tax=Chitinophaga sp. TaxID=1869181 RepID=UPI002F9301CF